MTCIVCGNSRSRANWRCSTCNEYLRRTGRDRPPELLDKALQREMLAMSNRIGDTVHIRSGWRSPR